MASPFYFIMSVSTAILFLWWFSYDSKQNLIQHQALVMVYLWSRFLNRGQPKSFFSSPPEDFQTVSVSLHALGHPIKCLPSWFSRPVVIFPARTYCSGVFHLLLPEHCSVPQPWQRWWNSPETERTRINTHAPLQGSRWGTWFLRGASVGLLEKSPSSATSRDIPPRRAASVGYVKKKLEQRCCRSRSSLPARQRV